MIFTNCTGSLGDGEEIKECTLLGTSILYEIGFYIMLGIATVGSTLNSFALITFAFSNNMTTKFLRYLKYYIVNSFVCTTNYMIMFSLILSLNGSVFGNQHKMYNPNILESYAFATYYSYIFMPIWTVSYSFGSFLDIAFAYERILMYLPTVNFMRGIKLYVSLPTMLVLSCLVNLPANMSREVYETTLNFDANLTTKVYRTDRRIFQYNSLFTVCLYISTFLRDILTMAVELTVTVFLVITIVKFYQNKKRVVTGEENAEQKTFRKTVMDNSKISLYISMVSCINHVGTFLCLIFLFFASPSLYITILTLNGYVLLTRHSFDSFLLLKLNKKFKTNCIRLIPACLKIKRTNRPDILSTVMPTSSQYKNNESVPGTNQTIGLKNMFAITPLPVEKDKK